MNWLLFDNQVLWSRIAGRRGVRHAVGSTTAASPGRPHDGAAAARRLTSALAHNPG